MNKLRILQYRDKFFIEAHRKGIFKRYWHELAGDGPDDYWYANKMGGVRRTKYYKSQKEAQSEIDKWNDPANAYDGVRVVPGTETDIK